MRFKPVLLIILFASACAALPIPGFNGSSKAQKTETSSTTTTEEMNVNGRPVSVAARDDDEPDEPRAAKPAKKNKHGDIGKTCRKNSECAADACFVGNGNLGYCTKMCNSWSECPSHWECKRAANAPQTICMQDD
ncbi:MAG TPA: hypothetical protein VIV11_36990 [Kofleriaceae bacterium]